MPCRVVTAVLCVLGALAGCGGEEAGPVADNGAGGLLLAYEAGNHLHHYGARVYEDGRYEQFSAPGTAPADWSAYEPFTPEQVGELRAVVDAAVAAGLPSRIPAGDPPPPDAMTARFVLRDDEIVVGDFPAKAPPEIGRVLDRIAELRRREPVPSTWELWTGEELVALEARCEIGEVERLRALRDAIFLPSAPPAKGAAGVGDPPAGTPLARITFATAKGPEVLEVGADGLRTDRTPAGGEQVRELDPDRMAAIRDALGATDWAALPKRLC